GGVRGDVAVVGVFAAEESLADGPAGALCRVRRLPVGGGGPFSFDGDDVVLDVEVDVVRINSWQVELDAESIAVAPGVHRHHHGASRCPGDSEDFSAQALDFAEWVSAHHDHW